MKPMMLGIACLSTLALAGPAAAWVHSGAPGVATPRGRRAAGAPPAREEARRQVAVAPGVPADIAAAQPQGAPVPGAAPGIGAVLRQEAEGRGTAPVPTARPTQAATTAPITRRRWSTTTMEPGAGTAAAGYRRGSRGGRCCRRCGRRGGSQCEQRRRDVECLCRGCRGRCGRGAARLRDERDLPCAAWWLYLQPYRRTGLLPLRRRVVQPILRGQWHVLSRRSRPWVGAYSAAGRAGIGTVFGPNRSRYGAVSISSSSMSRASTRRFHAW